MELHEKRELIVGAIDLDGVMANFEKAAMGNSHMRNKAGFFEDLELIAGAKLAMIRLSRYFEMHIVSTSPWSNPSAASEKYRWVQKNLGKMAFKRLTLTHSKDRFRAHFIIDDRIKNGISAFEGEHIHIFTDPRFMTWEAVTEYLIEKYAKGVEHPYSTYWQEKD